MHTIIKLILVGDSDVGKTSCMDRFIHNSFSTHPCFTIGVDYGSKKIIKNNEEVVVRIWDTAGQEKFQSIVDLYFRNTHGALLFFNLTCKKSFYNAFHVWLPKINRNDIPVILVGNKSDSNEIKIYQDEIQQKCEEYNLMYIETSAKKDVNVVYAFESIIEKVQSIHTQQVESERKILLDKKPKKKCCSL